MVPWHEVLMKFHSLLDGLEAMEDMSHGSYSVAGCGCYQSYTPSLIYVLLKLNFWFCGLNKFYRHVPCFICWRARGICRLCPLIVNNSIANEAAAAPHPLLLKSSLVVKLMNSSVKV